METGFLFSRWFREGIVVVDDRVPGIVEVLTSNGKMFFGVFALLLALLFAFSGIYIRSGTIRRQGTVSSGESVVIEKRKQVDSGVLTLGASSGRENRSLEVYLLGKNENKLMVRSLPVGEEVSLTIGARASSFKLVGGPGKVSYEYRLNYSYQPLRSLSIPAALLTVFGVIAVYRGFDQFMVKFAEEKVDETEGPTEEGDESNHVDFMGGEDEGGEGHPEQ